MPSMHSDRPILVGDCGVSGLSSTRSAPRGLHAAWLGIEWVNEPVVETAVQALAADLQRNNIGTVYVYTTYMRGNSTFGQTYAHAPSFRPAVEKGLPRSHCSGMDRSPAKAAHPRPLGGRRSTWLTRISEPGSWNSRFIWSRRWALTGYTSTQNRWPPETDISSASWRR